MVSRRLLAAALVAALLLGCSYQAEEPGLFDRTTPSLGGRQPSAPPPSPPATNPDLPVLGEAVWTSADGSEVQVRIALHALRRIEGGAVLDWSVTPLSAPNRQPGDPLPALDLGLSRAADERPRITLVDARSDTAYRPLVGVAGPASCVCTPLTSAQRNLQIGHTTMLQVAFGVLPAGTTAIDVAIATIPPFWRVPVTPIDRVPVAVEAGSLAGPVESAQSTTDRTAMFRYGPGEQVLRLQPRRVVASSTFATLEWTIWSVTGGAGLESVVGPPLAEPGEGDLMPIEPVASGPALVVAGGSRPRDARLIAADGAGDAVECLCSPLSSWASALRRPDKPATVVTTFGPLPAGTDRVEVRWEGLDDIAVPVTTAPDSRSRAGAPRPWRPTTWDSASLRSGQGWTTDDWPTPVPAAAELAAEPPRAGRLVR